MNTINLAILGLGTVGVGVLTLIQDNIDELTRRTGHRIQITHVGVRRHRDDIPSHITQSDDLMSIASNPTVDIVIEVMGGITTAKDVILHAINHGKHVVTANKALLAEYGNEIFKAADTHNVHVAFEAAVAGGIPIIKVMREALAANKIDWLAGIINGTGNFIMTKMAGEQQRFDLALSEAQRLGYAEADPAFDVEGTDAAHKLSLLASIAFGIPLQFDKVYCEGITTVNLQDIIYAKELGYTVKHLGVAKRRDDGIELRVHPTLIPDETLLASVNGVKNAVMVSAHPLGQTLYYGDGAGAGATASAVMADVVDLARLIGADTDSHYVPHLAFEHLTNTPILSADDMCTAYYLRIHVTDEVGILSEVTRILSDNNISIDAILQKPNQNNDDVSIIILTQPTIESNMNAAITKLQVLPAVKEPVVRLRLEELE